MKISKDNLIFNMDKDNKAVVKVNSGEEIIFETCDCFSDTIKTEKDTMSSIDFSKINPATGPVYINEAKVGDILKVDILKINISNQGVMMAAPGLGRLGNLVETEETVVVKIKDNFADFRGIKAPLRKMIGVIGTAPEGEAINTGTPHDHGGNMDCLEIKEGSSLYLPVNVDGALLALGDLHASMGEGEIMGTGVEISGEVTLRVEVIKDKKMPTPMIENEKKLICLASRKTLEESCDLAIKNMASYLVENYNFTFNEAGMFLSMAGDLKICQIVDPNMTVRMEVQKSLIEQKKRG